jgi:SAM-dependent methyltransferase
MINTYQDEKGSENYLNFLNSENGQIQQEVLYNAILKHLSANKSQQILDAACGPGWLTKKLSLTFINAQGCDASDILINYAKKNYKGLEFKIANLEQSLPYEDNSFDSIILNMAAPDIENLVAAYKNLGAKLKNGGQLIVTVPNPYYTSPVGEWKRNFLDIILGKKPKLKLKPYFGPKKIQREFNEGEKINSFYHTLPEYIDNARSAGLTLVYTEEIKSSVDDKKFSLKYALYRYPLFLLLEFTKLASM